MPRASRYLVQGYTYHLTHRCHNRSFLLRFARDRDVYRKWLREGIRRHRVPIYGYCLTHNHVHVIAHADNVQAVSDLMHLAAGSTAKQYNLRKDHLGSMWEHPFQCTRIQDGRHLFNCLCYVDMNMVRAGVVTHPEQWKWCGYHELMGVRKRNRLLAMERLLDSLECSGIEAFRERYAEALAQRIELRRLAREAYWTEALAVGSKAFVAQTQNDYSHRRTYVLDEIGEGSDRAWMVRETAPSYTPI